MLQSVFVFVVLERLAFVIPTSTPPCEIAPNVPLVKLYHWLALLSRIATQTLSKARTASVCGVSAVGGGSVYASTISRYGDEGLGGK